MPRYEVNGATKTFTECPEAREFVLENYRTMSIKEMSAATGVRYHNVARLLETKGLMADRYTKKRQYVAVVDAMTDSQIAYLAGMLDGDGTLGAAVRAAESQNPYIRPYVVVTNTSILLVEWLQGRGFQPTKRTNTNGRPYWICTWSGFQLEGLLTRLLPHLVIKQRQAQLLLELISLRRQQSKNSQPAERMLRIVKLLGWLNERSLSREEKIRRERLSISSLHDMSSSWVV